MTSNKKTKEQVGYEPAQCCFNCEGSPGPTLRASCLVVVCGLKAQFIQQTDADFFSGHWRMMMTAMVAPKSVGT